LAVVKELRSSDEVLWIGSEGGMEKDLVERAGIAFEAIPAAGVHGVGAGQLPRNLWKLLQGVAAARGKLKAFSPDVLFFTGGYVGVPVALAGLDHPKLVFVPDIEPGLALRLITRLAKVTAVISEDAREHYGARRDVIVTGYPTRFEKGRPSKLRAREMLDLDQDRDVVMIMGGSRGARSINLASWSILRELLSMTQVIHVTGSLDWPRVEGVIASLPPELAPRYHPSEFLHEEIAAALAAADLVVSRAGAATLGEYPLFGLPAILVPYPHAWRYQKTNADSLTRAGAALQIDDVDLMEKLLPTLRQLLGDKERLSEMAVAMGRRATPGAARRLATELQRTASKIGGVDD
jgi:UDP-N-acetylglucosamine--N-acetylmuramyl-(pentapeptide) pyrophosphoryl-undecaprenol N-acetylglucosamine transferase